MLGRRAAALATKATLGARNNRFAASQPVVTPATPHLAEYVVIDILTSYLLALLLFTRQAGPRASDSGQPHGGRDGRGCALALRRVHVQEHARVR